MTAELEPGFEALPQPPSRYRLGRLLAAIGTAVVLAVGGAVAYAAMASGNQGATTPIAAVRQVITSLERADLIGVLDDLAPAEQAALVGPLRADITALQRLNVLTAQANASSVRGLTFTAHNLRYTASPVNDHVQIVQLNGGTIDVGADVAALPLTAQFLHLTHGTGQTRHADLARHPVRIATEKVGRNWYASLTYTAADAAAKHAVPSAGDAIAATGASSAQAAVQQAVRAVLGGDLRAALELVSPAELQAVHDYGDLLLPKAAAHRAPVTLTSLELTSQTISSGGVRVGLRKAVLTMHGRQFSIALAGGCADIDAGFIKQHVCAANAGDLVNLFVSGMRCPLSFHHGGSCQGAGLTAGQKRAIGDLLSGITTVGIDTARVNGSWFVAPIRTVADLGPSVLAKLKGNDLLDLASLRH